MPKRIHKNTIKVAVPLFFIGIGALIILTIFQKDILHLAQQQYDKITEQFGLVQKQKDEEPIRLTLAEKKTAKAKQALGAIKPADLIAFNRFIRTEKIAADQRTFAGLLYFYPYGFTEYGANKTEYNSSLHDFSVIIPKTWKIFPIYSNYIGLLSPDTILDYDGRLTEPNEAFDIFIFKDCDFKTMDELVADTAKRLRSAPVIKISGPTQIQLAQYKATKYVYRVPQEAYSRPVYWFQDVYFEDYYLTIGKGMYLINYVYVPTMNQKYRATAAQVLKTFTPEGTSCTDDFHGLSRDLIDAFYTGHGSLYTQNKSITPSK